MQQCLWELLQQYTVIWEVAWSLAAFDGINIFWGNFSNLSYRSSNLFFRGLWTEQKSIALRICVGYERVFCVNGLWPRSNPTLLVNVTLIRSQLDAAGGSCCPSFSEDQRLIAVYCLSLSKNELYLLVSWTITTQQSLHNKCVCDGFFY